jgi:hypothetical protein
MMVNLNIQCLFLLTVELKFVKKSKKRRCLKRDGDPVCWSSPGPGSGAAIGLHWKDNLDVTL